MNHKLYCEFIPEEFFSNKNEAKQYFRQFGRVKRLTFRPKSQSCVVEYISQIGFETALQNAGDYKGRAFKVNQHPVKCKTVRSVKKKTSKDLALIETVIKRIKSPTRDVDPDWVDDPDVRAELDAMGGIRFYPDKKYDLSSEAMLVDPSSKLQAKSIDKLPKVKRSWKTECPKSPKKKKLFRKTLEHIELMQIIKQQALTIEDKLKILDARDKLIRLINKSNVQEVKVEATVGICPDMCPEKERLLREIQHQVSIYEQEFGGRGINPSLAVKQYSRSSADQEVPLPHELRPVTVLKMTMAYLMHQIMDQCDMLDVNLAEWYHFLWDRTRGIRKDITQQALCCQGSVELVEQCARFHIFCSARLVAEDPSVFDQKINTENLTKCLQTLKYMYHDLAIKSESCRNEAEFRAYIILLNLNDGNFMWEVQHLRPAIQRSQEVQFALSVYSAIDKNNYIRFFKLVHSTTYLNGCLLMRYFVQVRTKAIKTLLKSYSPRIPHTLFPLKDLTRIFAFENINATVDFLEAHGLFLNTERTYVILDRKHFCLPKYPYHLDRAIQVVESKRTSSVGETICGSKLPTKEFEYHIPEQSFNVKGYLKLGKYLNEADIAEMPQNLDFSQDQNEADKESISTSSSKSLFTSPIVVCDSDSDKTKDINSKTGQRSLFGIKEIPQNITDTSGNIFQNYSADTLNIIPNFTAQNVFSNFASDNSNKIGENTVDNSSILKRPHADQLYISRENDSKIRFFEWEIPSKDVLETSSQINSRSGILESQAKSPISSSSFQDHSQKLIDLNFKAQSPFWNKTSQGVLEKQKQDQLEKQMCLKKEIEEKRKNLEIEKHKLIQERHKMRLEKAKTEERLKKEKTLEQNLTLAQQKIREDNLRQFKREEEQILLEKLRREEERNKKVAEEAEINKTIKMLLDEVVSIVENNVRNEKLFFITTKIYKRISKKYFLKWQDVCKNKLKRKALDCSPCWLYSKTVQEEADDLAMCSQDTTLRFVKRYKRGKPFDLNPMIDEQTNFLNVHDLIGDIFIKRLYQFDSVLPRYLYFKITLSLPDSEELIHGVGKMNDILARYIHWETRNDSSIYIEKANINNSHEITYCIEKQRGMKKTGNNDSNGFIFVANDFNDKLCNRIIENLKDFGVYVKIPIVILLQNYDGNKTNLKKLIDEEIVSDYVIIVDNFNPSTLINIIEEGLVFLSSKVEKSPPLEMDTLKSFLDKYLCSDVWKRAIDFSKWNTDYRTCLKKPNIVIHLFNECVSKLKEIILNKAYIEYAHFPDIFKELLPNDMPNYLPCDYKYFPKFWSDPSYLKYISNIMEHLYFPKLNERWPQNNEFELEVSISKYCTKAFKKPEKPFYKIMSVILSNVKHNLNFDDINWINVIEALALEKVNEINYSLNETDFNNKSAYNQLIVVYDPRILLDYKMTNWFYVSNPIIKNNIEYHISSELPREVEHSDKLDTHVDLDKALSDLLKKGSDKHNVLKMQDELKNVNKLMNDLEDSITINRKISRKFETVLENTIGQN